MSNYTQIITKERLAQLNELTEREDKMYMVECRGYKVIGSHIEEINNDWYRGEADTLEEAVQIMLQENKYAPLNYKYYDLYISFAYDDGDQVSYEALDDYKYHCGNVRSVLFHHEVLESLDTFNAEIKLLEHLGFGECFEENDEKEVINKLEDEGHLIEVTGKDYKEYVWYKDDSKEALIRLEDSKIINKTDAEYDVFVEENFQ